MAPVIFNQVFLSWAR